MKQLKEVCAYIRVSTGKQEELSPDSQLRLIKEYAQAHDMLLTHVYMEEHGISGKFSEKRPAFQEMIAACKDKSHPYDAVLLWKFSRFARNQDEATYYKSILRKKCNVDVISISEPIIEGMYGRLIEMVIEWSDEFYLVNLSGEVMRGMTQNALNGGYNSNPPIGYTKKRGEIPQVDPERAELVRRIFRMFTEQHMSRNDIASTLNGRSVGNPDRYLYSGESVLYRQDPMELLRSVAEPAQGYRRRDPVRWAARTNYICRYLCCCRTPSCKGAHHKQLRPEAKRCGYEALAFQYGPLFLLWCFPGI